MKTSYDPIEGGLQKHGFATKISPSTVFKVTGSIFRLLSANFVTTNGRMLFLDMLIIRSSGVRMH